MSMLKQPLHIIPDFVGWGVLVGHLWHASAWNACAALHGVGVNPGRPVLHRISKDSA
jgi:hypothetical protein